MRRRSVSWLKHAINGEPPTGVLQAKSWLHNWENKFTRRKEKDNIHAQNSSDSGCAIPQIGSCRRRADLIGHKRSAGEGRGWPTGISRSGDFPNNFPNIHDGERTQWGRAERLPVQQGDGRQNGNWRSGSGAPHLQGGPRELLLVDRCNWYFANVFRPKLVRRLVEVPCEVRDGLDVRTDRLRGIVPQSKIVGLCWRSFVTTVLLSPVHSEPT